MAAESEGNKDKLLVDPLALGHVSLAEEYKNKGRRRSTIHSYTLTNYHALPSELGSHRGQCRMTQGKALKNVIVVGVAFMFVYTAFVSLQGLQSSLNHRDGVGVLSLSCIYMATVISCLLSPSVIRLLTTKWTMVLSFVFFTGYFAGNFHPEEYMLFPLGISLGILAGPLWSAVATTITTVAVAYSEHAHIEEQEVIIAKFMGIFCGLFRTSNIWGNLITTLVLTQNHTPFLIDSRSRGNMTLNLTCGSAYCPYEQLSPEVSQSEFLGSVPQNTRIMLLSIYLGCGLMGIVTMVSLLDGDRCLETSGGLDNLSTKELLLSTWQMLQDSRCQLLVLMVILVGLEQGFMMADFTRAYIVCTLGVRSIGPIMMSFGAVSAISCLLIAYFASKHIKRFAFIIAGATFNVGLLIVLWLWKPRVSDVPNFLVVAGCLGLCDAIWQTQTYTLFGVLFVDRQEAAFSCYRMLYSTGSALAFGYNHFLCVETKVYILGIVLLLSLVMYCVIEMKVQLQSQHIKDIVAL